MDNRLERWRGKVALVTGATSGIGQSTARALAKLGMKMAISGRRGERLEKLKTEFEEAGVECVTLVGDQTEMETNRGLFHRVREEWGGVDVLINNAGTSGGRGLAEVDLKTVDQCLDLNVRAAVVCMQEAVRDMRAKGGGAIVNISSMGGHRIMPRPNTSVVYSAGKHALRVMTDGLRAEMAAEKSRIKIALISPGMVDTEWHHRLGQEYEFKPLDPEDITDAVLFILSTPPHVQVCDILHPFRRADRLIRRFR